jgi:hypothetical protein
VSYNMEDDCDAADEDAGASCGDSNLIIPWSAPSCSSISCRSF